MNEIKLHKATNMTPSRPVNWLLAPSYLAKGKTNLLVGAEGIGKSLWTIRAMAAVTTGKAWGPFTMSTQPADVVLIATEDGWEDTIRPRLELAGADLERLHVLSENNDGTGPATSKDLDVLKRSNIKAALVVADAWADTVSGNLNVKDPQQCRKAVEPWKEYASYIGAAILLVTHTNRNDSGSPRDTYGLSGGLRQIARSTLYALEDPDTSALLVGPEKSNLSSAAVAQRFVCESMQKFEASDSNDGTVPCLQYLGPDDRTIREIVAAQHQDRQQGNRPRKTDEIDDWLRCALAAQAVPSAELEQCAAEDGISKHQLERAKGRVGAKSNKVGNKWYTELATTENVQP
jgi:hypothetical protein